MAVKTFTDSTTLPASDINTYLNNGGLVYITEASVTSGSTISISNCFTSTYTNYRIIGYNITTSGTAALAFQFLAAGTPAATNYNAQRFYVQGVATGGNRTTGDTSFNFAYIASSSGQSTTMEVFSPAVATPTKMMLDQMYLDPSTSPNIDIRRGIHTTSTAYDGFRVTTTDTFLTATIVVYGYRKA